MGVIRSVEVIKTMRQIVQLLIRLSDAVLITLISGHCLSPGGEKVRNTTWSSAISRREVIVKYGGMTVPGGRKCQCGIFKKNHENAGDSRRIWEG